MRKPIEPIVFDSNVPEETGLPISFFIVMFVSITIFITFIIGAVVFVKNQYPEPQIDVVVFDDRLYDCQKMTVGNKTTWTDREGNQFILITKNKK